MVEKQVSPVVKAAEKFNEGILNAKEAMDIIKEGARPDAPHLVPEPEPPYNRRENSPMKEEYMKQMTAMMVMANLYNCSPGRKPEETARIACSAADALWEEWCKHREPRKY